MLYRARLNNCLYCALTKNCPNLQSDSITFPGQAKAPTCFSTCKQRMTPVQAAAGVESRSAGKRFGRQGAPQKTKASIVLMMMSKASAREMFWIVQILLKGNMQFRVGLKTFLKALHPDAYTVWEAYAARCLTPVPTICLFNNKDRGEVSVCSVCSVCSISPDAYTVWEAYAARRLIPVPTISYARSAQTHTRRRLRDPEAQQTRIRRVQTSIALRFRPQLGPSYREEKNLQQA